MKVNVTHLICYQCNPSVVYVVSEEVKINSASNLLLVFFFLHLFGAIIGVHKLVFIACVLSRGFDPPIPSKVDFIILIS